MPGGAVSSVCPAARLSCFAHVEQMPNRQATRQDSQSVWAPVKVSSSKTAPVHSAPSVRL